MFNTHIQKLFNMKKLSGSLVVILIHVLFIETTFAQVRNTAMVPLPSVDDFTRGNDGWSFALGFGVEYESAYEGSDEFGFEVEPAGAVQWRRGDNIFYWAGESLGWRGLRAETWLFETAVGFDEGREESDSDDGHLNGMGDGDEGVEFVLQTRYAFDPNWRNWLVGRVVTGENGTLGLFGVGHRFGDKMDGSGSEINFVAAFHDSSFANKDFGINAVQSAASGLVETKMSGGFRSIGIDYTYRYYLNDKWQLFGEALYEHYSSDIADSPISRNDYEAEVSLGLIYLF